MPAQFGQGIEMAGQTAFQLERVASLQGFAYRMILAAVVAHRMYEAMPGHANEMNASSSFAS